jgi:hypothetical protein
MGYTAARAEFGSHLVRNAVITQAPIRRAAHTAPERACADSLQNLARISYDKFTTIRLVVE